MSVVTRIRISQELTVPFTPEEVWRVLADVGAYPGWWPAALRVELVHNPSNLLGAEFEVRPLLGSMFRIRVEELEGTASMRLRFFGSLEGPGGFHLLALDGATRVRYEMDVFARGLDVAVLSVVLPLERIYRSRMRAVLQNLSARLAALRVAEEQARRRVEEDEGARRVVEATQRRRAEEEAATHAAAEEEERRALTEASAREANEAAQRLAAEEENQRRAAEEASRRDEEESARRDAEEAARRLAQEEDSARDANEAAQRLAAEEENQHRGGAEARRRYEEEGASRAAEEAARAAAEKRATRRSAEEEAADRAAETRAVTHASDSEVSGNVDHAEPGDGVSTGSRLRPFWGRMVNWLREPPAGAPAPSPPTRDSLDQPRADPSASNFDIAQGYLKALSSSAPAEEIGRYLAPDITHEEFPHRFLEAPVRRGFGGILEARSSALARFESQRYDLAGATGGGSQVAMEVRWKGSVATTGAGFTGGQELDARIAFFLKFADGKIVRERTYPCFEPWSTRAERLLILDERVAQAGQSTQAPPDGPGYAPMEPMGSNFEIARSYLDALGARADAGTIARFYAADAVQDEFPNRFLPGGAHRDLQGIKLARSRGLALMASESYELMGATGGGPQVALEAAWSGVVGEGLGLFSVGQKLEARLAIFFEFRDGLIVSQRNYACAPPGM